MHERLELVGADVVAARRVTTRVVGQVEERVRAARHASAAALNASVIDLGLSWA